jgi:hypothetical protein
VSIVAGFWIRDESSHSRPPYCPSNSSSSFQFSGIDYARIEAELESEVHAGPRAGWVPLEGSGLKVHPKMRDLNISTKVAYRRELEAEQLAGRTL